MEISLLWSVDKPVFFSPSLATMPHWTQQPRRAPAAGWYFSE